MTQEERIKLTKELIEGCEVWSVDWEGCVIVVDGQFVQDGEVICSNPTEAQLNALFEEMYYASCEEYDD